MPAASANVTLNNSILADSTGGVTDFVQMTNASDGIHSGTVASIGSNNIITNSSTFQGTASNANPLLALLGNYGGPTQTMPPLPGSPVIDAGSNALIPNGVTTDQRGFTRIVNGAVDIGAFESSGFTIAVTSGSGQSTYVSTAFSAPLVATVTANNPSEPVAGGLITFTPPQSGASATISGSPATISDAGTASVTATANSSPGSYTVSASAAGAVGPTPVSFTLSNFDNVPPEGLMVSLSVPGLSPAAKPPLVVVGHGFTVSGSFQDPFDYIPHTVTIAVGPTDPIALSPGTVSLPGGVVSFSVVCAFDVAPSVLASVLEGITVTVTNVLGGSVSAPPLLIYVESVVPQSVTPATVLSVPPGTTVGASFSRRAGRPRCRPTAAPTAMSSSPMTQLPLPTLVTTIYEVARRQPHSNTTR